MDHPLILIKNLCYAFVGCTYSYVCIIAVNVGTNPGLAAIWEDEQQRRREANESSQISAPPTQGQNIVDG